MHPSGFACPALLGFWVGLVSPLFLLPSVYSVLGRFVSSCGSACRLFPWCCNWLCLFPPFFSALGCVFVPVNESGLRVASMPQCPLGLRSLLFCICLQFCVHSCQLPLCLPRFLPAGMVWSPIRCWGLSFVRVSVPVRGFWSSCCSVPPFLLGVGLWSCIDIPCG